MASAETIEKWWQVSKHRSLFPLEHSHARRGSRVGREFCGGFSSFHLHRLDSSALVSYTQSGESYQLDEVGLDVSSSTSGSNNPIWGEANEDSMDAQLSLSASQGSPNFFQRSWHKVKALFVPPKVYHDRTISYQPNSVSVDTQTKALPPNIVRNQKYYASTFIFVVLYNEFKFFFNLYFLLVALSQLVPALRIGLLLRCHCLRLFSRLPIHVHCPPRICSEHYNREGGV